MPPGDSFRRFENRATDYAGGRPDYPAALLDFLLGRLALRAGAEVADIGSGTGIFTRALLARGLRVAAVEPGDDMRRTAEAELGAQPGFTSSSGTARATKLPARSVEAIFCAQAFHWFNEEPTRREWRRILRPGGSAVLVWNNRDPADAFTAEFLAVLHSGGADATRTMAASLGAQTDNVLFRGAPAETVAFPHAQSLDFAGLLRLTVSASFMPKPGDARFPEISDRLRGIFDRHQAAGAVRMVYRTVAVFGEIR